jgi:hypothetical protein
MPLVGHAQPFAERAPAITGVVAGVVTTGAEDAAPPFTGRVITVVFNEPDGDVDVLLDDCATAVGDDDEPEERPSKRIVCPTWMVYGSAILFLAAKAFQSHP